jgi:hypothetical protein
VPRKKTTLPDDGVLGLIEKVITDMEGNYMENKNNTQKRQYQPPMAKFVTLQVEERLMACSKTPLDSGCSQETNFAS